MRESVRERVIYVTQHIHKLPKNTVISQTEGRRERGKCGGGVGRSGERGRVEKVPERERGRIITV